MVAFPGLGAMDSRRRGSRRTAYRPLLPTCCCDAAGIAPADRHNTTGKKICDYPSQRRAIVTVSSSCMFLWGSHPPDALSLQEKREGGAWGEAHVCREKPFRPPHGQGKREPERRETKDRVTGRGRERGGVGGTVKTRGALLCTYCEHTEEQTVEHGVKNTKDTDSILWECIHW